MYIDLGSKRTLKKVSKEASSALAEKKIVHYLVTCDAGCYPTVKIHS